MSVVDFILTRPRRRQHLFLAKHDNNTASSFHHKGRRRKKPPTTTTTTTTTADSSLTLCSPPPRSSLILLIFILANIVVSPTLGVPIVTPAVVVNRSSWATSNDQINKLPGVVVFVAPKTALISHEIANQVVSELRQQNEVEFPIRLRKVKCDFAEAVKAVYEMSSLEFQTSFLLTDLCPDVNFRLSQVLKYRNISLITASDNNPAFRDRSMYANTFSILPSTESLARATLKFLQQNDWKKMLLVYDAHTPASSYYSLIASSLLRYLESYQIEIGRPIENKAFDVTMSNIQKSGFKIVFLLMPAQEIAEFLCRYLQETPESSVPRLAWLLHTDVSDLPIEIVLEETCSGVEKLRLLTAFAVRFAPYNLMENDTSAIKMPHPNGIMCSDRSRNRPRQVETSAVLAQSPTIRYVNGTETISHYYRCYYYDGLMSIFRALRDSVASNTDLHDSQAIWSTFQKLKIDGKTGHIRFNRITCERVGQVEIVQLSNGRPRWIVVYDLSSSPYTPSTHYRRVRWPRGRPPLDSVVRREELLSVPFELLAAFSAAALLGIAASVGILITNIRFRGHSYIKMSSPNLNNFILIGSCLCYTNVIFQGLGTNLFASTRLFEAICIIEAWSLPIGFSLAFGAMLTKTWRVHTIFRHTTGFRRQVIPDSKLIFVVFSFVLLDVLLNAMWAVFDTQTRETTVTQTILADAYETTSFIESCSSSYALWWELALWLPKGALLIYGLVLAWKTRGVRLAALNDSYQIGVSIYIIVVLCTIGATAQPLFKTKVIISYCVLSATLLLCTVIPEIVIFLPKLLTLWKDPIGDQRLLREEMKRATKSTDRVVNELTRRYVTTELRMRRIRLAELDEDLDKMEMQLSQIKDSAAPDVNTNPEVSLSFAMVAIGASLMANPTNAMRHHQQQQQQQQQLPPQPELSSYHRTNAAATTTSPEQTVVVSVHSDEQDITCGKTASNSNNVTPAKQVTATNEEEKTINETLHIDVETTTNDEKMISSPSMLAVQESFSDSEDVDDGVCDNKNNQIQPSPSSTTNKQLSEIKEADRDERSSCASSEDESKDRTVVSASGDYINSSRSLLMIAVKKTTNNQQLQQNGGNKSTNNNRYNNHQHRNVRFRSNSYLTSSSNDIDGAYLLSLNTANYANNNSQPCSPRWQASSLSPPECHIQRSKSTCVNIYCDNETFL